MEEKINARKKLHDVNFGASFLLQESFPSAMCLISTPFSELQRKFQKLIFLSPSIPTALNSPEKNLTVAFIFIPTNKGHVDFPVTRHLLGLISITYYGSPIASSSSMSA